MSLQFDWVTDLVGIQSLESDWQALEDRCARAEHLFQTWLWNETWWKHFGRGSKYQLRLLTGRVGGNLVLVWPLVETRRGPVRILEGTGGLLTCFHDALVEEGLVGEQYIEAAWVWLKQNCRVDAISIAAVHQDANISRILERGPVEPVQVEACALIRLDNLSSYDDFARSRSKMFRKEMRRAMAKIEKLGKLEIQETDKTMLPTAAVATVIDFKRDWVRDQGLATSTVLTKQAEGFLAEYCALLHSGVDESVELHIGTVQLENCVIACGLAFSFRDQQFEYLGGFDRAYRKVGVGKLQLAASVAHAIKSNRRFCNLLTPMTEFKLRWTEDRAEVTQHFIARSLNGHCYRHVYLGAVRPIIKRLYNWVVPWVRRSRLNAPEQT